ncbi:hypothetical protein PGIGA_G00190980 [Pangasianodon gigas]|uniref:Uncharacterized protein n=1 Tax=Pangasianodon gigas TaxID=30993 RepID=A0ACC5WC77_PANGG|nr:hypothetical protein [Pangasianodon gigas]
MILAALVLDRLGPVSERRLSENSEYVNPEMWKKRRYLKPEKAGRSIHSINVQIICDAAHIITNVEAKWPGSVHDSRMYRESTLSNRLECGEIDRFLLGDRGYPCQPTLITPYPEPEPGPQQHFNVAHCRTRARVEMTIGLLKARFQCLLHLRVTPERACDIIAACVVLHNIAIIRGEQHPALQIQDPEEDPIHPADFQDGRVVRDIICRNFFSD